jgi:hypothetical protein
MTSHATAQERRLRAWLVQRAIETAAPLLAAPLDAYAQAEGMDWMALANSIGCAPDDLNRIALCRAPRAARFVEDVHEIAEGCADPDRLLPLLRRLQILETFRADRAAESHAAYQDDHTLLAARDRTDGAEQSENSGYNTYKSAGQKNDA